MRSRFKHFLIYGAAVAVAFFGVGSTALAATAAPARSSTSAVTAPAIAHLPAGAVAPHVVAAHPVAHGIILDVADFAPKGCAPGDVCFYSKGNGGNLCGSYPGNVPNLGTCANIGPSGSIYNNGNPCSGCQDVNLYYDTGYGGAFYCLPMGHYLLYIEQNHFDRGGAQADGLGQTLAYVGGSKPGGVASVRWGSC